MGLFDKAPKIEGTNYFGKPSLPPGQSPTTKFPVLTYGPTPTIDLAEWRLNVFGSVVERSWTWQEFMALPQSTLKADFHCVTHWSRFGDEWTGVSFRDLASLLSIEPSATYVVQHAYGGYTTNLPLRWMLDEDVMLVHSMNGTPLEPDHGGPLRVLTPRRYAWKGAKWIRALEFLEKDRPGFWEVNGYSNTADPWKEERFW